VQAATFDSKKKATAAAILGTLYANHPKTTSKYWADVGDFYYGTANNKSGNAMNYPETIGPDSHVDGPALPVSTYEADVGYFVDSTAINAAGNMTFRDPLPGRQVDGPPLPPAKYAADVGYFIDGNALNHAVFEFGTLSTAFRSNVLLHSSVFI
jgi:hypothetical protein